MLENLVISEIFGVSLNEAKNFIVLKYKELQTIPLRVCRNQRIHIHKVFKGIAQRGKCSMGWFFGFKLHLICNERGELLNFMITPGDVDDRKPLEYKAFVEFIYGKLVGDKGYISKNLFQRLFVDGIQVISFLLART